MRRLDLVLEVIVVLFAVLLLFDTFDIHEVTGMVTAEVPAEKTGQADVLDSTVCPVDTGLITAGFHSRLYGQEGHTTPTYPHHTGIDVGVDCGTPVRAAFGGTAYFYFSAFGWGNGWGNNIVVYSDNIVARYAHLQGFPEGVANGDRRQVVKGELIGYVGSTGKSTGCHLHFEIYKDNVLMNPRFYSCFDLPCEPGWCDETPGEIEQARQGRGEPKLPEPVKPEEPKTEPEPTKLPAGMSLRYEVMPSFRQGIDYSLSDYEQLGLFAKDIVGSCSGSSDVVGCIGGYDNRQVGDGLYLKVGSCGGVEDVFDGLVQLFNDCKKQDSCYCGDISVKDLPSSYKLKVTQSNDKTIVELYNGGGLVKSETVANDLFYYNDYSGEKEELDSLEIYDGMEHGIGSAFLFNDLVYVAGSNGNSGLLFKGAGFKENPETKECSASGSGNVYRFCAVSDKKLLVHDELTGKTEYKPMVYKFALEIK